MGDHRGLPPEPHPSAARDASVGRPTELDAITGSVVRAGRRLGVSTPVLDGLLADAAEATLGDLDDDDARRRPRSGRRRRHVATARLDATLVGRVVLGVAALYALVVGALALLRYESFASDFDHGIFSQYVWLLGHLHEPFNTIVLRTLLGDHVEPGIALLAPLGTLGVGAPGILVVQTLALAATAPLLYLLARGHGARGLGRGRAGAPLVRVARRAAAGAARLPSGDARARCSSSAAACSSRASVSSGSS